MRRALASGEAKKGLPGTPAPVAGSIRRTAPSSVAGPSVRRTLWLRSAPPSAAGGLSARADRAGRVAARVCLVAGVGRAVLPVVDVVEARAVAAGDVEIPVAAEQQRADRVAGELLAPVVDEHLLAAGHDVPAELQSRHPPRHEAAVGGRAGRGRAAVVPGRRDAADRGVVRVQHVDVRARRGSSGSSARPSSPRSQ